jgi:putative transcriptional regulator
MKYVFRIVAIAVLVLCASHAGDMLSRGSLSQRFVSADPPVQRELSRGVFLVAAEKLLDPNFSETIVLLLEYGPEGAMGLVINRPTRVRLSEALPEIRELRRSKETVYVGGPVGIDTLLLLVHSVEQPEESYHIFDDVYLCSSLDVLRDILEGPRDDADFRVYVGYSGWAPRQLDSEVMRGDWHVMAADEANLFSLKPESIWSEFIERSRALWI